jgi:hypothetical protein
LRYNGSGNVGVLLKESVMTEFTKPKVAALAKDGVAKVQAVEKKLGTYVIAYEQPVEPASLTAEQLKELERLEGELGVCLVAYRKS